MALDKENKKQIMPEQTSKIVVIGSLNPTKEC